MLVGHTHFDHAIDVPAIARRFDAPGVRLGVARAPDARCTGSADSRSRSSRYRRYELGPFVVSLRAERCTRSCCSAARVPFDGELTLRPPRRAHPRRLPLRPGVGDPHRGRRHELLPPGQREPDRRRALPAGGVDVFLAGVAGRSVHAALLGARPARASTRASSCRPLRRLLPAARRPLGFSATCNLAALPDEIHAVSRDARSPRSSRSRPVAG